MSLPPRQSCPNKQYPQHPYAPNPQSPSQTITASPKAAIASPNHAPSVTGKLSAALCVLSPAAAEEVEDADTAASPAALGVVDVGGDEAAATPTTLVMVDVIGDVPDAPALMMVVVRRVEVAAVAGAPT